MNYPRILTVQDISCLGQCSLTVALPILSACSAETVILPSAVLSNHTAPGYHGFTFCDLTEEMPKITQKWKEENVAYDAVYTGYLGSFQQIDLVKNIIRDFSPKWKIIDPAMGDNGTLYKGFDTAFAHKMATLCDGADYVLPNITEACFMTDTPYRESYDEAYVKDLMKKLTDLGAKNVLITGVGFEAGTTGFALMENGKYTYYPHEKLPKSYHGTGDVYSSVFTGALCQGLSAFDSAKLAAEFVMRSIRDTMPDDSHWYGVKFEMELGWLAKELN